MAPAPSPNSIHEFRSSQSTHRVNASAPITNAFCRRFVFFVVVVVVDPLLFKNWPAVTMPNRNPEHAAVKSKATHFLESHPIACAMYGASPNMSSGLDVAHITISICDACIPLMLNARWAASMPSERNVSGTTAVVAVVVVVASDAVVDVDGG
jgi:hypothetical protein